MTNAEGSWDIVGARSQIGAGIYMGAPEKIRTQIF